MKKLAHFRLLKNGVLNALYLVFFSFAIFEGTSNELTKNASLDSQIASIGALICTGLSKFMPEVNQVHLPKHKSPLSLDAKVTQITEAGVGIFCGTQGSGWYCGAHLLLYHLGCTFFLVVAPDDDWFPERLQLRDVICSLSSNKAFSKYQFSLSEAFIEPLAPPPDFCFFAGLFRA